MQTLFLYYKIAFKINSGRLLAHPKYIQNNFTLAEYFGHLGKFVRGVQIQKHKRNSTLTKE